MADLPSGTDEQPIELADAAPFALGDMRVIPAERAVEFGGERRDVQPRVMRVLVALAEPRPAVVSRDRLIERAWDGVVVGDDALNRCILALRHLAQEFDPPPFTIETVPRVGHRLVEGGVGTKGATGTASNARRRRLMAMLAVVLLAIVGVFAWQTRSSADAPTSIAVLPFRNLSAGEPFFAQGLSEEVLGQLAREPAFRVAGRNAAVEPSDEADLGKLGRSMGVEYILDGSVRSDRGRIRVNASLIQSSDGARLWSQTYDRDLDDVLAIQTAIGEDVAGHLKRALVDRPRQRPEVDGEAYALYLNARGLLRTGNPQMGAEAVKALEQVVLLDPGFAPGWSSLAEAMQLDARAKGPDALIAVVPRAIAAARRALRRDPNLAAAHATLALLHGDTSAQGIEHMRRAAELAPRTGEGMIWRAHANFASGRFDAGLADYRRAHQLDPAWPLPVRAMIDGLAARGDRAASEEMARRGFADDPMTQEFALARVAWVFGDVSEAARRWRNVAESSSRWAAPSRRSLVDARLALGLSDESMPRAASTTLVRSRYAPLWWMPEPPAPTTWREWNRSPAAQLVHLTDNIVAAKMMLSAGRAREIVAAFDSPVGFNSIRANTTPQPCHIVDAPIAALALRQVGREAEAEALLARSDRLIRDFYARGETVPVWLEADAAALWAVQGKPTAAIGALERAMRRGWAHLNPTDLRRLEDEPAFRSLHGSPRFEAVRKRLDGHFAREREQTRRALGIAA